MSKKITFLAVLALPALVLFQNCSGVSFGPAGVSGGAKLIALGENETIGEPTPEVLPLPIEEPVPPVAEEETPDQEVPPVLEDDDDTNLTYTCVLDGPGASVRLHLQESLLADQSTINIVCTSKSVCLDLVSQKFSVKAAKPSGFCGKNKHAITLNASQIAELLR